MFVGIDPLYYLLLAPGLLLAAWAQYRVQSAFHQGSQIPARSGVSGAQAAAEVMQTEGVHGVAIEPVAGALTDHYDPSHKVLRLSEPVYDGRSLAALGVAAHEAGHAIQDAHRYAPLVVRNLMVPAASFGSSAAWIIFFVGIIFHMAHLMIVGMALFSAVVLFQLVNLPVEFDASRRARVALQMSGLVSPEEDATVGRVLNAAALTYVAATLTSILTLLYFVIRSGLLGSSRDERRPQWSVVSGRWSEIAQTAESGSGSSLGRCAALSWGAIISGRANSAGAADGPP
jgi:Zn-dependent membrane protease YugP